MKMLNTSLIKLSLYLSIGIILGHFFSVHYYVAIGICLSFMILFGLDLKLTKRTMSPKAWSGVLTCLTIVAVGLLSITLHNQANFYSHYTKYLKASNSAHTIRFKVRDILKSNTYYDKYVVDVIEVDTTLVSGKLLVNIAKDSLKTPLQVDAILLANTQFKTIAEPLNAHQFNYRTYLQKQHIYHQLVLGYEQLLYTHQNKPTIYGITSKLQTKIKTQLKKFNFKTDEFAIINALLLGQRQDISAKVYASYKQAGVIHILAISGLHIGIILLVLSTLFKPLESIRQGKLLKAIVLICLLWAFAIVAGLSASVVRAVTMFSIVTVAINYKRPTNIYNTLAFSIVILLLLKPNFLFDVGFQLSYLAVFSIVTFQPMLYTLWAPKYRVLVYFWKLTTVTLAAQIGILPISLYYFHQFPGLFLISNLMIIPFLKVILIFGIIVILLALVSKLPAVLVTLYGYFISSMNNVINWVAMQDAFLFKNISFSLVNVILSYVLMLLLVNIIRKKRYSSVVAALAIILLTQGYFTFKKHYVDTDKLVVFHKSKHSIIGIKTDKTLNLHHNLSDSLAQDNTMLTNFMVGEHIDNVAYSNLKNVYAFNNKTVLLIDSLAVYDKTFKPSIIVLTQSPKINLDRLIQDLNPELIISDGSNFKSYSNRWKSTCMKYNCAFYDTSKQGAYTISLP